MMMIRTGSCCRFTNRSVFENTYPPDALSNTVQRKQIPCGLEIITNRANGNVSEGSNTALQANIWYFGWSFVRGRKQDHQQIEFVHGSHQRLSETFLQHPKRPLTFYVISSY